MRSAGAAGVALIAVALGAPAFAQRTAEMNMEAAGFRMRPATTPQQMARLRSVPPRRFVAQTRNGVRYYVYADPDGCRCAMVGGQQAYDAYRDMIAGPKPPPGYRAPSDMTQPSGMDPMHLVIHEMDRDLDPPDTPEDPFHPGF